MTGHRPALARVSAVALAVCGLLIGAASVSDAAVSYTLSGTVTEAGCGHGGAKCTPLPKGERLSVSISDSTAVGTAPVDASGHYSISLPAGGYFVTPGVANGPVEIERFTPEQVEVELASDRTANFTYTVSEPEPLGYLHLSGPLADVPVTSFELPQRSHVGRGFGPLDLVTAEVGLQRAIAAAVASGKVYPRATFDVFKRGTKTRTLAVAMRDAQLTDEHLPAGGTTIDFTLRAQEGTLTSSR